MSAPRVTAGEDVVASGCEREGFDLEDEVDASSTVIDHRCVDGFGESDERLAPPTAAEGHPVVAVGSGSLQRCVQQLSSDAAASLVLSDRDERGPVGLDQRHPDQPLFHHHSEADPAMRGQALERRQRELGCSGPEESLLARQLVGEQRDCLLQTRMRERHEETIGRGRVRSLGQSHVAIVASTRDRHVSAV